jgi:YbbR domain-containing protein
VDQKSTWLIKICCVIAAFSLWLYVTNVDNNQVSHRITVSVTLTGIDSVTSQKLKVLPGQQFNVTLNVKGTPADVALGKDQFKVVADLSQYAVSKGERQIPVLVERQPANVSVLNSQAYYVKVIFDDLVEKSLPVKVAIDGKVKEGFHALKQTIRPTDVTVSGAAKFVNQVVTVEARVDLKNSDKDINSSLVLKAYDAAGREIKDVDIEPSTVDVVIPIKRTKTVGINAKTVGNPINGYALKQLIITPDRVDIAGGDAVNSITSLNTVPIDLGTLSPNKEIVVKIDVPSGISLINSDGTIKVTAILDKIDTVNKTLAIQIRNLNSDFDASLDTKSLTLVISGPKSQLDALKDGDIACFVDLSSIANEGDHTVPVKVSVPNGINIVSSNPQNVKVTMKKKAATNAGGGQ